jgi:hypothetical protein
MVLSMGTTPGYKNNDTAQYNSNTAIITFTIFPCWLNTMLHIEPNNAQHSVPVNPINALS